MEGCLAMNEKKRHEWGDGSVAIDRSICLELVLVLAFERRILLIFYQRGIPRGEDVDLGAHEIAESVLRRADIWLTAHIKARIHDHRTAGLRINRADQSAIAGLVSAWTVWMRAE
jgi:hypothetical protein